MDRSRTYTDMCRGASEIQERWKQAYGDFYLEPTGRITCWIQKEPATCRVKKGFRIECDDGVIRLSRMVWLPRQDQLIEMAQVRGRSYDNTVLDFYHWTKTPYDRQEHIPAKLFPSMEQVWLAYVMHRKFGKKWNGASWRMGA